MLNGRTFDTREAYVMLSYASCMMNGQESNDMKDRDGDIESVKNTKTKSDMKER